MITVTIGEVRLADESGRCTRGESSQSAFRKIQGRELTAEGRAKLNKKDGEEEDKAD